MDDIYQRIGANRAVVLFDHFKAIIALDEAKQEAAADFNERMAIVKRDGFDRNMMAFLLKRHKAGRGQSMAFDVMLQDYEKAINSQAGLGLDQQDIDPFAIDDAEQRG